MKCVDLQGILEKYFTVHSVEELFESLDNSTIIDYINKTAFLWSIVTLGISV